MAAAPILNCGSVGGHNSNTAKSTIYGDPKKEESDTHVAGVKGEESSMLKGHYTAESVLETTEDLIHEDVVVSRKRAPKVPIDG